MVGRHHHIGANKPGHQRAKPPISSTGVARPLGPAIRREGPYTANMQRNFGTATTFRLFGASLLSPICFFSTSSRFRARKHKPTATNHLRHFTSTPYPPVQTPERTGRTGWTTISPNFPIHSKPALMPRTFALLCPELIYKMPDRSLECEFLRTSPLSGGGVNRTRDAWALAGRGLPAARPCLNHSKTACNRR